MKLKKLSLLPLAIFAAVAAHADTTTGPDATAITTQLSDGIDSGMTVATKVVGVLITLFVVGLVVGLIRKGRAAAR